MADPQLKQIKIKTGTVKRFIKDKSSYEREAEGQKNRIAQMKAEGKDEYDIRKQEEVLTESQMMIPDTVRRLDSAVQDLNLLLTGETTGLQDTEEYKAAKSIISEAELVLKTT